MGFTEIAGRKCFSKSGFYSQYANKRPVNVAFKTRLHEIILFERQISVQPENDFLANAKKTGSYTCARIRLRVTGDMPKKEAIEVSEALCRIKGSRKSSLR